MLNVVTDRDGRSEPEANPSAAPRTLELGGDAAMDARTPAVTLAPALTGPHRRQCERNAKGRGGRDSLVEGGHDATA